MKWRIVKDGDFWWAMKGARVDKFDTFEEAHRWLWRELSLRYWEIGGRL